MSKRNKERNQDKITPHYYQIRAEKEPFNKVKNVLSVQRTNVMDLQFFSFSGIFDKSHQISLNKANSFQSNLNFVPFKLSYFMEESKLFLTVFFIQRSITAESNGIKIN